jgi:hypothetical protein
MSDQHKSDAIADALTALESNEPVLWALPLVHALEITRRFKAIEWAVSEYIQQNKRFRSPPSETELRWLDEIRSLLKSGLDTWESLGARSREIWQHDLPADRYQKGIADLYAALSASARDDEVGYRKYVARAIGKLCKMEPSPDQDTLREILDAFEQQ